jgi:hypothetical protein
MVNFLELTASLRRPVTEDLEKIITKHESVEIIKIARFWTIYRWNSGMRNLRIGFLSVEIICYAILFDFRRILISLDSV